MSASALPPPDPIRGSARPSTFIFPQWERRRQALALSRHGRIAPHQTVTAMSREINSPYA